MQGLLDATAAALESDAAAEAFLWLLAAYGMLGVVMRGADAPQWYLVLLNFVAVKAATGYDKCKVSYYECKLRGVRRRRGVVDSFCRGVMRVSGRRQDGTLAGVLAFAAAVNVYFFAVRGQQLRI